MNIQLIQGEYSSKDALEVITHIIHAKIKYHEHKIAKNSNEEDIKHRESNIKKLYNELFQLRDITNEKRQNLKLDVLIKIEI